MCDDLTAGSWNICFVVDDQSVILGCLERRAIQERANVSATDAMTFGPSTIRPSARLHEMVERLRRQNRTSLPVTRSDGVLVEVLLREDAERALADIG